MPHDGLIKILIIPIYMLLNWVVQRKDNDYVYLLD